jgi:glycosyltransferase involved in cell wall biosynthesis
MTLRFLAVSCAFLWGALDALTSSVIIPCHAPHFQYLEELLQSYERQTRPPDEVVIALSGCSQLDPEAIHKLQEQAFAFPVRYICNEGPVSRGANRNLAAGQASGDVLVCQDADDVPHPKRIELCMRVFEGQPSVNFVLHGCALSIESVKPKTTFAVQLAQEEFLAMDFSSESLPAFPYPSGKLPRQHHCFCNGVPTLKRSLWSSGSRWIESLQRTEDVRFVRTLVNHHGGGIFLNLPLYYYRRDLSAGYTGKSVWERGAA